ncbi:MAG: tRNA (guanosine(37)-N1)-methyltransferase TrmD [Rhodothermales bacterium]|nr:tRNA (guanosine(37)-N1)-methyltransferase TrmD [Rhodothermales bacterium]
MQIDIVTGLPDLLGGFIEESIVGIARKKGIVELTVHNLRDFGVGKHRQIDDYPYGGGSGMVLMAEPIFRCLESIGVKPNTEGTDREEVIFLTPDGQRFDQKTANALTMKHRLVLIAGHYKGIDQRVRDYFVTKEISIGDYVLSGGELAAAVVVDAVCRLMPGVLGDSMSALSDSFQDDTLDAPAYTRPASFREMDVPEVLLSGDHRRIHDWRESMRMDKTRERRPDLLDL